MKKIIFSISVLLFASCLYADARYQAIVDIDFSPYAGGEDILTFQHALVVGEDKLVGRPPSWTNFVNGMGRFLEMIPWGITNTYLMITQHEIFGHGYRLRDIGPLYAKNIRYKYKWYGAATYYKPTHRLTTSLQTTIASGGVEGTAILANRLRLKWLASGHIDGREATLYTQSQQDITNYTLSMKILGPDHEGHDISMYIYFLNATYRPYGHLTKKQLEKWVLINYLDPFTYFAYISWFKFISSGTPFNLPMIPIGDYKYMPSVRLGLAPFGPEYFLENFLVKDGKPIYFYIKGGSFAKNNYFGFGIEQPYLFHWKGFDIGYRLDAWRQPHVLFKKGELNAEQVFELKSQNEPVPQLYSSSTLHKQSLGISLYAIIQKQIKESHFYYFFEPGFKTKGFLPGEALRAAPIVRLGFSIQF